MLNRRDLKIVHEEAVLHQFGVHLERCGINLQILDRPEPPEALVEFDGKKTWIEITDAFLDERHAISLTTGASDDVGHITDAGRLVVDPDETFSRVLYSVIEAKYDKPSMRRIVEGHGSGILLVGIFTPFTTAEAVAHNEAVTIAEIVSRKPVQVFKTIYAYDGTGQRSFHALYRQEA